MLLRRSPPDAAPQPPGATLGCVVLALATSLACARVDGRARAYTPPSPNYARGSGCIDTPFVGRDAPAGSGGVQCGRRASNLEVSVRGRVVGMQGGLPGQGLEGLWITVHPDAGGVDSIAAEKAQTGPQGQFEVHLRSAGEQLVAVRRGSERGAVVAARRVDPAVDDMGSELVLYVELGNTGAGEPGEGEGAR